MTSSLLLSLLPTFSSKRILQPSSSTSHCPSSALFCLRCLVLVLFFSICADWTGRHIRRTDHCLLPKQNNFIWTIGSPHIHTNTQTNTQSYKHTQRTQSYTLTCTNHAIPSHPPIDN